MKPVPPTEDKIASPSPEMPALELPPYRNGERLEAHQHLVMAVELSMAKRHADAIQVCSEAIRLQPEYVEAYDWRARTKGKDGDYQGALEDYNHILQNHQNYTKIAAIRAAKRATETLIAIKQADAPVSPSIPSPRSAFTSWTGSHAEKARKEQTDPGKGRG